MIISLHMPKAGGSSFKEILQRHYGNAIAWDYEDKPINATFEERTRAAAQFDAQLNRFRRWTYSLSGIKCIHGHFLPAKYKRFQQREDNLFITWLREPAERLISHYYYWQRDCNEHSGQLHRKMIEEAWDLETFCLSPEMQNIYTQLFWDFPQENFDFIGIMEHYKEDTAYFVETFLNPNQSRQPVPKKNVNTQQVRLYSDKLPSDLLAKIKAFHAEDYAIYEKALAMREKRIKSGETVS